MGGSRLQPMRLDRAPGLETRDYWGSFDSSTVVVVRAGGVVTDVICAGVSPRSVAGTIVGGVLIILCAALGFTSYLISAEVPARAEGVTTRSWYRGSRCWIPAPQFGNRQAHRAAP